MNAERARDAERALWTIVWLAVVSVGLNTWSSWSLWSGFSVVAPALILLGSVGVVLVWTVPARHQSDLEHAALCVALGTVVVTYAPSMLAARYFNTDAAAFNQRATWLLAHGKNPYAAIFRGANVALSHAATYWTYLLNGGHVNQVSYPAGSFVLQLPLQWLGVHSLGTNWLDLAAWLSASLFLYFVSPPLARWLAPLLLLTSVYTFSFAHGGTDALFIPFLMVAAYRWDHFVIEGARWTRWLGPLALGVACSIKQTPWFCVPFFVLGVVLESSGRQRRVGRDVASYLAAVSLPFVLLNLPFVLWSPSQWWRGATLPLREPLVPDGQGLVTLTTHGLLHVLYPERLQWSAALALAALLVAYWHWYPTLKSTWLFVLPVVLFLPSRSLSSYLVDFVPVAFVMALSTRRTISRSLNPRRRWYVLAPAVCSLVLAVSAFVGNPLGIRLNDVHVTRVGLRFTTMSLTLTNYTSTPVRPHVMVIVGSAHPVGFWSFVGAPAGVTLGAHQVRTYVVRAPQLMYTPARYENWLIEVTSSSPAFVVTTAPQRWRRGPNHSLSDGRVSATTSTHETRARVRG